jgi:Raf kinase inhibitor-like YbhB/YbcL family protein
MASNLKPILISLLLLFWGVIPHFAAQGDRMEIASTAFKDGGKIPIQYVTVPAGGKNLSIPLAWENAPLETKSFALSMIDPHPVAQNWIHWFVINIPASATSLPEGASRKNMPAATVELKNSFGEIGDGGPQPPKGSGEHPYVVTLYALNVEKLDLGTSVSLPAFKKAMEGKIIQSATITGKYER